MIFMIWLDYILIKEGIIIVRKKILSFVLSSLLPFGMGMVSSVSAGGGQSVQKENNGDAGDRPKKRARKDTEENSLEKPLCPEPSEAGSPPGSDDADTQPIDYSKLEDLSKSSFSMKAIPHVVTQSGKEDSPEEAKTPVLPDQDADEGDTQPLSPPELPSTPALPEPEVCEFVKARTPEVMPIEKWKELCDEVKPLVSRGSHVQEVEGPAMIIGDLHGDGQAADFYCKKFEELLASGRCRSIVLLGDYVDRGKCAALESLKLFFV